VDALLDAKPSRAEPWLRLLASGPHHLRRPESENPVIVTMVVFLGLVMITCLVGVAVIPRFDRRAPLSWRQAQVADDGRVSTPRSA
jgi:hypothetical protein